MRRLGNLDLDMIESLFDQMPGCPFFVKNSDLKYVSANQAMLELFSLDTKPEIYGHSVGDFLPPKQAVRFEAMDRQILRTGAWTLCKVVREISRGYIFHVFQ